MEIYIYIFVGPEELRGRQVDTDDDLNNRMLDMSLKSPGAGPSSPSFNQFRPQQPGYYPHSALHKASYSGMPPNRQQFSSQQPSNVPPLGILIYYIYFLKI